MVLYTIYTEFKQTYTLAAIMQLLWHIECHSPQPEVVELHLRADYAFGISDTHNTLTKK